MPHKPAVVYASLALMLPVALAQTDYIDSAALGEAGLVMFWQLQLPLQPGQAVVDSYLVDDQAYLTTQDGYAYVIDAHTGAIRWIRQVTTGGYRLRRPCHAGNRTIFVTPPAVTQYERYTGQPIRLTELRFPAASAPISDGTLLFVGGIDQRIYAFHLDQDFELWKSRASGQVIARPALSASGKHLYFAGEDGSLYACTAHDKKFYWQTRLAGSITADLVVDSQNLYVACRDQSLYSLSPDDGGRRWRTRFSGPLHQPPAVIGDLAFQYCAEDGLAAIDTQAKGDDERVRWLLPRGRSVLAADAQQAYVLSRDASILVVRLGDGTVLQTIPAPGFTFALPSPDDLALYVAAADGRIFCARKHGVPPLLASEVQHASLGPGTAGEAAAGTAEGAAQAPAAGEDARQSRQPGPPIGGKSKVTREYGGG